MDFVYRAMPETVRDELPDGGITYINAIVRFALENLPEFGAPLKQMIVALYAEKNPNERFVYDPNRSSPSAPAMLYIDADRYLVTVENTKLSDATPAELESYAGYEILEGPLVGQRFDMFSRPLPPEPGGTPPPPAASSAVPSVSSSVQRALKQVGTGSIPAAALVAALFRLHPEYGAQQAGRVQLDDAAGTPPRPAAQWLDAIRPLFDATLVETLHGRTMIVGLCLLDPQLRARLEANGFLDLLVGELTPPLDALLTPEGTRLWRRETAAPADVGEEETPTHTDNPALVDELGRKGFAKILARRIVDVRRDEGQNAKRLPDKRARNGSSLLLHLHAPWGAGKTSTLNFLAAELRDQGWVVVEFNAWRHQRIVPPWWWLMTTIYRESLRELRTKWDERHESRLRAAWSATLLVAREWTWRLRGGWSGYLMVLVTVALLVAVWHLGALHSLRSGHAFSLQTMKGVVIAAAAIITPALTIWGLVRGAGHWIFATSARGARRYMENTRDPMRAVQEHVKDLVYWIGRDVVVLVDDLDRCKGAYVVELLEGIQTMFRDMPVTYVVAADRDWLSDSYAAEYTSFVSAAAEPGRPFGYLFLEKTFQISATLPPISTYLGAFWTRLLHSAALPTENQIADARKEVEAETDVDELFTKAQQHVAAAKGRTPTPAAAAQLQAVLEKVAVEAASARAEAATRHTLEPFSNLLDANPRAMKRLVNAYGIARGAETLRGHNLERNRDDEQRTALWTILNLRWPKLGDHLERHPEDVAAIGNGGPTETVPVDLRPLFADPDVAAVVGGTAKDVVARLDAAAIRSLTRPQPPATA